MTGLEIGKTYTDGWGKRWKIMGISLQNPDWFVTADPQEAGAVNSAMFRKTDGRKCTWNRATGIWRCDGPATNWDLVIG